MKKNLFFAALLCSISFAGKAATNETKAAGLAKKPTAAAVKPARVKYLYEMTFDCPKQGWSIPVVGYTRQEMANAYMFYQTHLDC
ncbi:hypothetical protein GCM10027594_12890 [Hymenobacter agri]